LGRRGEERTGALCGDFEFFLYLGFWIDGLGDELFREDGTGN
jgi:hypothetical protein